MPSSILVSAAAVALAVVVFLIRRLNANVLIGASKDDVSIIILFFSSTWLSSTLYMK